MIQKTKSQDPCILICSSLFRPAVFESCEHPLTIFAPLLTPCCCLLSPQRMPNYTELCKRYSDGSVSWPKPYESLKQQLSNVYHLFCSHRVVSHLDRVDMCASQWEWSILTRCFGDTWQESRSLKYMYKHTANSVYCVLGIKWEELIEGWEREWFAWFHLTAAYLSVSCCSVVLGWSALFISSQSSPEVLHNLFFWHLWLKE